MFEPLIDLEVEDIPKKQKVKPEKKTKAQDNGSPKPEVGTEIAVMGIRKKDGTEKAAILMNEFSEVGIDADTGDSINAWVQRERQEIAQEIISTLIFIGVKIFNTNGFISCYDPATKGWYLFDEPTKIMVLVDTYIRCLKVEIKGGNRINIPVDAPKNVGEYMIHSREEIEKLDSVVNLMRHPYFDNNNEIVNTPGYNSDTQFYLPEDCTIDENAWQMKLTEAYDIFEEAFGSMNYRDDIDKQADLAAFLTPPWKLVVGSTPIISVSGNAPGTGKGLRQGVFDAIWNQHTSAVISKPSSEDELRKQLFATLRTGMGFISIDNISNKLLSDTIATYATEAYLSDRPIYGRAVETYPNNLIISVNGNNLRLSEDISTRILPIHLNINESSLVKDYAAEGRKTEHEIKSYAENNRDKIIGASLRISKEFINDMMPNYATGASRFDTWRKYVLGSVYHTCEVLEMPYLLSNATIKAKIDADPESQIRATLWKAILDIIGLSSEDGNVSNPFFTGVDDVYGIFDIASHFDRIGSKPPLGHDILSEYIAGHTERSRQTQLGVYFRDTAVGKIHHGWRLVKSNKPVRVNRALKNAYQLVLVNENDFYCPGSEMWSRAGDTSIEEDNIIDDIPL